MNHMTCEHIDFVPAKHLKCWHGDMESIIIFSRKLGKKIYKKRNWPIGIVCKDGRDWQFEVFRVASLSLRTMIVVTSFVYDLDRGAIKFDPEKGELTNE